MESEVVDVALYPPVLFLHGRLAGYVSASVRKFVEKVPVNAHIILKPKDELAPFTYEKHTNIIQYSRGNLSKDDIWRLVLTEKPSLVVVSGWSDESYLQIAKRAKKELRIPTVCLMDNQWHGTLRQHLASIYYSRNLLSIFDYIWVPGMYQYEFARRLGFKKKQIKTGFYCADLDAFSTSFKSHDTENKDIPHRFLYVGRFIERKGLKTYFKALTEICEKIDNDWEFFFIGKGPLRSQIPKHPQVKVFDFMQPSQLAQFTSEGGVFVLPSLFEPWGVVVHEFAASAYPLILSDAVGARSAFLREDYNGFLFSSGDAIELEKKLTQMIQINPEERIKMSRRSRQLSTTINHEMWCRTLLTLMKSHSNE